MSHARPITAPDDEALDDLCDRLAAEADQTDQADRWPAQQLAACAEYGVYRWFVSPGQGGFGWDEADLMRGYLRLSAACLTTTFVITQASGALRKVY